MQRRLSLPALAVLALGLMAAAIVLIAYVAPEDADQGLSQKIFYFHVPIALTAYASAEDRERALAAGYDAHVAKPVDADELGAALARLAPRSRV